MVDGVSYLYVTNLQGDVMAIINQSGELLVEYTYDAWGNILSVTGPLADTLGADNPLRYRGYVYDTETGLYYLQSRYYNPEISRFINADAFVSTGQGILGNNMFAYCGNNPVMYIDAAGNEPISILIGTVVAYAASALVLMLLGNNLARELSEMPAQSALPSSNDVIKNGINSIENQATINYAKKSKKSGKEKSSDKPSYVSQDDIDPSKTAQQNATDILNQKFGEGNWPKGPGSDFNKIVKWIHRGVGMFVFEMYKMKVEWDLE
jgi:RHS repeat-associated protein